MNQELNKLAEKYFNGDVNVAKIWNKKYGINGESPLDIWKRIAKLVSEVEDENVQKEWEIKFNDILKDFKFIPGGRIVFGLTDDIKNKNRRKNVLNNCFFLPKPEDNLESILDIAYKMSKVYSMGGGCGIDLSKIRPKGSKVNNSAIYSDGVVPFMKIYSSVTENIAISGRRGALILTIDCDHPDIFEFINSKKNLSSINSANISIKITDKFMHAVINDDYWDLIFIVKDTGEEIHKIHKAKEIFDLIVQSNWENAEPGLLFWDKIQNYTPNSNFTKFRPAGVNPCGEENLPEWGSCNLGNINLTKFVKYGFTKRAEFDYNEFEKVLRIAVRLMDNVNTIQVKYDLLPFEEQKNIIESGRQIGIGLLGLADMLVLMGIKYDSEKSLDFCSVLAEKFRNIVYDESCELAIEKGPFPDFDKDLYLKSEFSQKLPEVIKEKIKSTGIRNVSLMTIPPTGTAAIIAGVSSGIEPIFQLEYDRKVKLGDNGSEKVIKVYHPLYQRYLEKEYQVDKNIWVTAHDVDSIYRVKLQGIWQKYFDNSLSSTINLPSTATKDDIEKIYLTAWKEGLKGITVYRDGCRENVLQSKKRRPKFLSGKTYQVKDENNNTYYITINDILEGINPKPFEIFVNSKVNNEYINVITRLISAIMRRTNDFEFVTKQLKKSTKNDNDFLNKLSEILEEHINKKKNQPQLLQKEHIVEEDKDFKKIDFEICPECKKESLKIEGGCAQCVECGWGRCSI